MCQSCCNGNTILTGESCQRLCSSPENTNRDKGRVTPARVQLQPLEGRMRQENMYEPHLFLCYSHSLQQKASQIIKTNSSCSWNTDSHLKSEWDNVTLWSTHTHSFFFKWQNFILFKVLLWHLLEDSSQWFFFFNLCWSQRQFSPHCAQKLFNYVIKSGLNTSSWPEVFTTCFTRFQRQSFYF